MTATRASGPSRGQEIVHAAGRAWLDLETLFCGHHGYRKFCIVGIARTGSTLLLNILNAPGNVLAFGELFRTENEIGWDRPAFAGFRNTEAAALYRGDPLAFLERHVFRRWPRRIRAVGFKIFYYHAQLHPWDAVWKYLERQHEIAIVHIVRVNILRQYLSLGIAFQTGVWSSPVGSGASTAEPIYLDIDDCVRHFDYVRESELACRQRFALHRLLEIRYENLVTDLEREIFRLQEFLGLPRQPVKTARQRQQLRPLSAMIANYGELERALVETPWAGFLDD
jgi:LPS sulfotransferase NodH